MSDIMMVGVLAMPYELAMDTELGRRQYWDRAQQALERIAALETEIERLRTELAEAHAENAEQARLLGISGSVEARLLARVAELEREVAEAQRDAARYQWIRQRDNARAVEIVMTVFEPRALDAAIDAAMQEGER